MSYGRKNGLIAQYRLNGHAFRIWRNADGDIKLTIMLHWDRGANHIIEWTSKLKFPHSMQAMDRGERILMGASDARTNG